MRYLIIFSLMLLQNLYANPLPSPTFEEIAQEITKGKHTFDDKRINIDVPYYADNPSQVPITVDATSITDVKRLIIVVDLNPETYVIDMKPQALLPFFKTNIRVAQETPIRAFVQTADDKWIIGSNLIKSAGGGCAAPNKEGTETAYDTLLGKSKYSLKHEHAYDVIAFSIFHPMDTGFAFGKEPFFIESIKITSGKESVAEIETFATLSQNPKITLKSPHLRTPYIINLKDNDANTFTITVPNQKEK